MDNLEIPEVLPTLDALLWRLHCRGEHSNANALRMQATAISKLPVTYNCPSQEA